jgi:uncharacterized membrane protein
MVVFSQFESSRIKQTAISMWNEYFSALCDSLLDCTCEPLRQWARAQRRNKNRLTAEQQEALESIPGWKWCYTWDEQLEDLRKYVAAHNKLPKQRHDPLGIWVHTQRTNKDKLTAEKKAALGAVPGWVWKTREIKNKYTWDEQLAALHEYVDANNEMPSTSHERLGTWISTQRKSQGMLTPEKKAALEAIPGWVWKMRDVKNKYSWDEQLEALREYVATNSELPKTTHERLGNWIYHQRVSQYKLSSKKQAALEAIPGWIWKTREIKNKYSWEEQFAALREYVVAHNELPKTTHERLGMWIMTQRRNKSLTAEKKAALESIPGWDWKAYKVKNKFSWDEQLAALREYVEIHGTFPKCSHERLGKWMTNQRQNKWLTAEKKAALEAIPGWVWKKRERPQHGYYWNVPYSWMDQYCALREYVASHKALPKPSHERLGAWVATQRRYFRNHVLTAVCIKALQSVPMWEW